jgi:WYL domain/TnsA endonuclease N terminal
MLNILKWGRSTMLKLSDLKKDVIRAIQEDMQINISYYSEEGINNRKVDPWYLLKKKTKLYSSYYLFGYCYLRKEVRCFHLKRIQKFDCLSDCVQKSAIPLSKLFNLKNQSSSSKFYSNRENFTAYAYPDIFEEDITNMSIQLSKNIIVKKQLKNKLFEPKNDTYPIKIQLSKMKKLAKCRSPLEHKVLLELESNPAVSEIKIEPIKIQYFYKRISNVYIPDILIKYSDGREDLIEIKLAGDVGSPKNQAKFLAAENYAKKNGYRFYILGIEGNSRNFKDRCDWSDLNLIKPKIFSSTDISYYSPFPLNKEKVKKNKRSNDIGDGMEKNKNNHKKKKNRRRTIFHLRSNRRYLKKKRRIAR